jgi:hypothetical protein
LHKTLTALRELYNTRNLTNLNLPYGELSGSGFGLNDLQFLLLRVARHDPTLEDIDQRFQKAYHSANRDVKLCAFGVPKIEGRLLGLTVLCELVNWDELKTFYGFERWLIYKQARDGCEFRDMSWFVRWATDHLLDFKISGKAAGKITDEAWAERLREKLEPLSITLSDDL